MIKNAADEISARLAAAEAKDAVVEAAMKRYRPHPSCDNARLETDLYHACAELSQAQKEVQGE